jgi:arylsulfatase
LQVWREPYTELRIPLLFNLRTDPFERAQLTSNTYEDWFIDHAYIMGPAQFYVAAQAQSLAEFPRRQEPASFTIDKVLAKLEEGVGSS